MSVDGRRMRRGCSEMRFSPLLLLLVLSLGLIQTPSSLVAAWSFSPQHTSGIAFRRSTQKDSPSSLGSSPVVEDVVNGQEIIDGATVVDPDASLKQKKKTLALLTFDLDDTLYPIAPVIEEANAAFARSAAQFGFTDIQPSQINESAKKFREQVAVAQGPEAAAVLTHTEVRRAAIRQAMEESVWKRKLNAAMTAESTRLESLSPVLVSHAKRWAATAVSESIVDAVLQAWEMERHHAAERHLYPEVMDALRKIREDHPNVVIGAVTDGKANPLLMTFTLAPFFDFCLSWEDDQGARSNFFKDLSSASSNADLQWIYNAAVEKYQELAEAKEALEVSSSIVSSGDDGSQAPEVEKPFLTGDKVWIHVGDDLAYDVGGSAQCGAKTIYCELADKYRQTARHRFYENTEDEKPDQPSWSTTSRMELEKRKIMNDAALKQVDAKLSFLGQLPDTINDLLKK